MALKNEYQCGRLKVNLRILVEPKGFLRITMLVIALLAFAITAGFNSSNSNRLECVNSTQSVVITFSYPYTPGDFRDTFSTNVNCSATFSRKTFSSSAQYFVGMGVLSMLYVIGAIIVYMLFITPELFMAKWLILGDFLLTLLLGLLYLLADIAWSVGIADLRSFVRDGLRSRGDCLGCNGEVNLQSFVQPAISVIFGWLAAFLWVSSIWFVYKDTHWHKDQSGPLASLYAKKKGTEETTGGGGGGGEAEEGGGEKRREG